MFPKDLTEQKKKLMAMLGTAVAGLSHLDTLMRTVRALGRRHAGYGVKPRHYAPVGSALLWTLEQGLGTAFTRKWRTHASVVWLRSPEPRARLRRRPVRSWSEMSKHPATL
jgi:hypothetical protein